MLDTDHSNLSSSELLAWGLANLWQEGRKGGYVVQHGRQPVRDFGISASDGTGDYNPSVENYWEKVFPTLFPYGRGGIEMQREVYVPFMEHVRWLLQFHDRRFRTHSSFAFVACGIHQRHQALQSARVQMGSRDFARVATVLSSLTLDDFAHAAEEEENGLPLSNPSMRLFKKYMQSTASRIPGSDAFRFRLCSQIWSTSVRLNPPNV